jgi:hypothetical protein
VSIQFYLSSNVFKILQCAAFAGLAYVNGIGIVQPFILLEFAVRTVKPVLARLSAIGHISVATRWFVQVQL